MIKAYSWTTPNGHKLNIMLEETGLEYELHPVPLGQKRQFEPDYLEINPNGKIPAIVDSDGPDGKEIRIMESGAILIYLATKADMLIPHNRREYLHMLQWLFFQVGHVGPMFGQAHHFSDFAPEEIPYAVKRYDNEAARLLGVLQCRLAANDYFSGPNYTIADIATFPWIRSGAGDISLDSYPAVRRWCEVIGDRPAVKRGLDWMRGESS